MKKLLLLIPVLFLLGCATYQGCHAIKEFYPKEKSCPSGYYSLGISDSGFCADEKVIKEIKNECGWMF
jgi:hypothetical protein